MTDRQTDRRQTENSNPSVPYDTFACFAGLIIRVSVFDQEHLCPRFFLTFKRRDTGSYSHFLDHERPTGTQC